ncbi:cilia- and flagella-associated protein 61-like [Pectinophora gossypiella]|uniref:cilia- and flagella-associated protein 61-like n=1 Tax=Pectinophora gossypiella TaxID=13191 RepID=UPI00214ED86F|nr:cilia- and flagella-associated protein 61-like [Pectinophora gossypiella]
MSIFFDFDVQDGRMFRRAVDQDKFDIERFWDREETQTLFNVEDVGALIELSVLAICMIDKDKCVQGFLALNDHPPVPSVDPASWEYWIRNLYKKHYLSRNTLFIHFICCMDSVSGFFLEEALTSVFMNDSYLHDIILIVPPACKVDYLEKYPLFKKRPVLRRCMAREEKVSCMYLLVASRQDFCPALKVRRAVEEDNDDIVEMLHKKCSKLKNMYGDYYISEIIARHPESNRSVIVAEHMDKVVGMMCLNPEVNYEKMQHTYELGAFHGLLLAKPLEREKLRRSNVLLKEFGNPLMRGELGPFDNIECETKFETQDDEPMSRRVSVVGGTARPSKVLFRPDRSRRHSYDTAHGSHLTNSQESEKLFSSVLSLTTMANYSLLLLLDDEPFDYDIINIDPRAIYTVPEMMSFTNDYEFECEKSQPKQDPALAEAARRRASMGEYQKGLLFEGTPNAFSIELFGMDSALVDERRAYDLLQAAFESLPTYDYCIIRIPTSQTSFALLHHFVFVPTKPTICCPYALYVANRNSVLGRMRVRPAEFADIPGIAKFLCNVDARETIYTIEKTIANNHTQWAYVFLSGLSIVGIGIVSLPENIELIRAKFMLDVFERPRYHISGNGLDGGFSMLKTALVYPAFAPHYAFFAREMMRMTASTTLVWLTAYRNKWVAHKANGIATAMTPVPYRGRSDSRIKEDLRHVYNKSKKILSFSAWFISKKLTSISKLNVDTRIVVVGASRTALAFLSALLFGDSSTYLTFTNVTLVSTHGLPYSRNHNSSAELMFPRFYTTSGRYLKSTPFTFYVNTVHGTMVEINKQDKYIRTDHGGKVFYDMLFLLIGRQHQHPMYMRSMSLREQEIKRGRIPPYVTMDNPSYIESQREPPTDLRIPENVFIINDIFDATKALNLLKNSITDYQKFTICVYGSCISTYCCISALLDIGVNPEDIVFVEPFPPEDDTKPRVPVFCNAKVDETVTEYLKSTNVTTHRGYYFHSWYVDEDDLVYCVEFLSQYHLLKLDVDAFFYYGKRYINAHAFVAINRCGLAYDGGILIDHQFRTNNPSIYAAGTATRYYRRYDSENKLHKFYDSREVGTVLAKQVRNALDPLFKTSETRSKQNTTNEESKESESCSSASSTSLSEQYGKKWLVPKLKEPLVMYCRLPGNLQYLEVRPPGSMFPHYFIQSMAYKGYVLETFKSGYFKLHLSNDLTVDGITCLTFQKKSISKLQVLYGRSAVMLNNVHLRFETGRIDDLYDFFNEGWSVYLYNEQAEIVLNMAKHLKPKNKPEGKTLEETLKLLGEGIKSGTKDLEGELRRLSSSKKSQYFEVIADFVIDFLSDNEVLFPMYITPQYLGEFTYEAELNCHTFKRRKNSIQNMLSLSDFNTWNKTF